MFDINSVFREDPKPNSAAMTIKARNMKDLVMDKYIHFGIGVDGINPTPI